MLKLRDVVLHENIDVYGCQEMLNEFVDVINRPKIKKYFTKEKIEQSLDLLVKSTIFLSLSK